MLPVKIKICDQKFETYFSNFKLNLKMIFCVCLTCFGVLEGCCCGEGARAVSPLGARCGAAAVGVVVSRTLHTWWGSPRAGPSLVSQPLALSAFPLVPEQRHLSVTLTTPTHTRTPAAHLWLWHTLSMILELSTSSIVRKSCMVIQKPGFIQLPFIFII